MHSCVNLEHHGMSRTRNQSPIKVLTFAYVAEKSYAHVPIEVSLESSPEVSAGTSLACLGLFWSERACCSFRYDALENSALRLNDTLMSLHYLQQ